MKSSIVKFYFLISLLLFSCVSYGQYIDLSGAWQSSSGNSFNVVMVRNGFVYNNFSSLDLINANYQGDNAYIADGFFNGNRFTNYFYALNYNTIKVYTSHNGKINYWYRLYECGVATNKFNFVYSNQRGANWCWAACVQMILNYYGVSIAQEQIVQRTFGSDYWGNLPDWPGRFSDISANLNNWSVDNYGYYYQVASTCYNGPPNADWLVSELELQHPVFIGYETGYGGHAVLITACTYIVVDGVKNIRTITVRDPSPGGGKLTYNGYDLAPHITAHWYIRVSR